MLAIADLGQVGVCLATATISRNPHLFYPSSPFSLDLGAAAPRRISIRLAARDVAALRKEAWSQGLSLSEAARLIIRTALKVSDTPTKKATPKSEKTEQP
jgi:hypothetical protein